LIALPRFALRLIVHLFSYLQSALTRFIILQSGL
jgi:hypothetical protein